MALGEGAAAVLTEWDPEELSQLQADDSEIAVVLGWKTNVRRPLWEEAIHLSILMVAHDLPIGGHFGFTKTLYQVRQRF